MVVALQGYWKDGLEILNQIGARNVRKDGRPVALGLPLFRSGFGFSLLRRSLDDVIPPLLCRLILGLLAIQLIEFRCDSFIGSPILEVHILRILLDLNILVELG